MSDITVSYGSWTSEVPEDNSGCLVVLAPGGVWRAPYENERRPLRIGGPSREAIADYLQRCRDAFGQRELTAVRLCHSNWAHHADQWWLQVQVRICARNVPLSEDKHVLPELRDLLLALPIGETTAVSAILRLMNEDAAKDLQEGEDLLFLQSIAQAMGEQ